MEVFLLKEWQAKVVFPDWKGQPDDTLAMNCMYSFFGYHGQGTVYIQTKPEVTAFRMYINGKRIDTASLRGGECFSVDVSGMTKDGENTVQISNIIPSGLTEAVTVFIPYPVILPGSPREEGINELTLEMISDLIECDIDNGFTSAQLAVIRNGRLVWEKAWGKINTYLPDGSRDHSSPAVTTDTLYDLASLTKMFSVNYALQKLVTEEAVDLDSRITDYLGDRFAGDTIASLGHEGDLPDLVKIRNWKKKLTLRDLLRHQGGFPADPNYSAPYLHTRDQTGASGRINPLYTENNGDETTRNAMIEAICKTPLEYEPGTQTVYSDVDYMLLGLVTEQITGEDLNTWLRKNFWEPMDLRHITYNPLKEGFDESDCAATELNGNTRDGLLKFPFYRTYTLRGEVHDEKAYYNMQGVSGHAGMFANASDLAKLASVMLCGGYGKHRFFSRNVMDQFTAPKKENAGNWGLGWWRQGDNQRVWYFGTQAGSGTIGHQGWTGTMVMIDPVRNLVIAYLTNRINSPVTDAKENADMFDGNWYTSSTLGFVPQILSLGIDAGPDLAGQLLDLSADMVIESMKRVPEKIRFSEEHPSVKNVRSKMPLFDRKGQKSDDKEHVHYLRRIVKEAVDQVCTDHEKGKENE